MGTLSKKMKAPEITEADKLKAAIEVRKHTIKVNIVDLWKRVQVRMIEQEISSRFVESEFALHVVYQIPRSLLKHLSPMIIVECIHLGSGMWCTFSEHLLSLVCLLVMPAS